MGCQCTKSSLQTDKNEILKDPSAQPNMSNVIKSKQLTSSISNKKFFDSLKKERTQFEDDGDATSNNNKGSINSNPLIANYNERIVTLLNKIRSNPSEYAQTVEDSIKNIQLNKNNKLIYKSKVKVTLVQGKPAFLNAIEILRKMNRMDPLIVKLDIIIPLPETKDQLKDINYFKGKVKEVQSKANVDIYFRDLVKHPETSALLMIVDDIERNPGKKRSAILNPLYKYIGVSSTFIDHSFMAYLSFSK